jgi:hypothetical protein
MSSVQSEYAFPFEKYRSACHTRSSESVYDTVEPALMRRWNGGVTAARMGLFVGAIVGDGTGGAGTGWFVTGGMLVGAERGATVGFGTNTTGDFVVVTGTGIVGGGPGTGWSVTKGILVGAERGASVGFGTTTTGAYVVVGNGIGGGVGTGWSVTGGTLVGAGRGADVGFGTGTGFGAVGAGCTGVDVVAMAGVLVLMMGALVGGGGGRDKGGAVPHLACKVKSTEKQGVTGFDQTKPFTTMLFCSPHGPSDK